MSPQPFPTYLCHTFGIQSLHLGHVPHAELSEVGVHDDVNGRVRRAIHEVVRERLALPREDKPVDWDVLLLSSEATTIIRLQSSVCAVDVGDGLMETHFDLAQTERGVRRLDDRGPRDALALPAEVTIVRVNFRSDVDAVGEAMPSRELRVKGDQRHFVEESIVDVPPDPSPDEAVEGIEVLKRSHGRAHHQGRVQFSPLVRRQEYDLPANAARYA